MKKQIFPQEVMNQYIETGIISEKATLEGDYKTNNKEGKKLIKLFKEFEKDAELAILSLPNLFSHQNVVTRTDAAAHCLALNIYVDEALKTLASIAADEKNGIFGFNAKMTLKVYHEQGFLKVYPDQKV